jgi:hypothetical protein
VTTDHYRNEIRRYKGESYPAVALGNAVGPKICHQEWGGELHTVEKPTGYLGLPVKPSFAELEDSLKLGCPDRGKE